MIYRAEGRGTSILSTNREGQLVDVLGPIGNGFPVEEAAPGQTALLVGEGIVFLVSRFAPLWNSATHRFRFGLRTRHDVCHGYR